MSLPRAVRLVLATLLCAASAARPESAMSWLENNAIRLGVDLDRGGAITWLSTADGINRVNNHDNGRQIQISCYSGPVPYEVGDQKPADHWKHLGWNPIQSGDDFGNGSEVLDHRNDGNEIYVKCHPLQWPLNHVPAECTFESWLTLDGPVVQARCRITNARTDTTHYAARAQEFPAVYLNGRFHRVATYTGARPFSGDAVTFIERKPSGGFPWSFWTATERWSALVDDDGEGVGLWQPHDCGFIGGFAGKPGGDDTKATSTGYLAAHFMATLDHDIVLDRRYELIVGSLDAIREHAGKRNAEEPLPTAWNFDQGRAGWHAKGVRDDGWRLNGGWHMRPEGTDPQLLSPVIAWPLTGDAAIEIELSVNPPQGFVDVFWRSAGDDTFKTAKTSRIPVADTPDFQLLRIPIHAPPGILTQIRIDPPSESPLSLRRVRLAAPRTGF